MTAPSLRAEGLHLPQSLVTIDTFTPVERGDAFGDLVS